MNIGGCQMKAIILGEIINGIRRVEEVNYGAGEDYTITQPILTESEIPDLEQQFGKNVYLGYDEDSNIFIPIYEDRPLTLGEQNTLLQQQLEEQEIRTADLEVMLAEILFN